MSAQDYFERGNEFFDNGQFQEAIEEYTRAVEIDPGFFKAWNKMGHAYRALGEFEKAMDCYKKSLEISPDQPETEANVEKSRRKYHLAGMERSKKERIVAEDEAPRAPSTPEIYSLEEGIVLDDEVSSEKTVPIQAKAAYFPRMQQGKIYPLSVLISSEKIRLLISDEQREKEIELPAKIGDIIEIHPICPALSISPASRRIKIKEGVSEQQFTVVPLVEGKFDINVEFYRDVELIGKIDLEYFSYKKKQWIPGVIIQKKPKQVNLGKVKIDISPRLTALYSGIATVFGVATGVLDQIGINWQSELQILFTQTLFVIIAVILAAIVLLGILIGTKPFQIEREAARFKPIRYEIE